MSTSPVIPDHTLLRVIGHGAYGEVWLARNVMGAPRAVKIIWRRQFDSDRPYEREFSGIQRYEPVSRMTDGLVQVLHVGRNQEQGYFYYVMELADDAGEQVGEWKREKGEPNISAVSSPADTLTFSPATYTPRTLRCDLKRLGRLPVANCLPVALDVVSGLAQLHQHGLVHRDVKPGNIIFVNRRAKLADIGLVSVREEGRTFVGTEGYIPPEGPGTPAADLYALGMALYEGATGYPPERFPKVPAEWFAEESGTEQIEFHEIVLKACEGAKERRYRSAEEMRADLALLQSGQSVRHVRALERRVARFRVLGAAAALTVLLAGVGVLFADYRMGVERQNRAKELALRERAEAAERDARQQLYTALLEQAHATVQSRELGQRVRALDAIRRAAAISNSPSLRREALAALAQPDLRFVREFSTGPEFTLVCLDPAFNRVAFGRVGGLVEIHALADNRLLAALPGTTNLVEARAVWSADGRFLALKRNDEPGDRHAEVWDVTNARPILVLRGILVDTVSFHPRLPQFMAADATGVVRVWDLENAQELIRFNLPGAPSGLEYSPDGKSFAALLQSQNRSTISVHDATNGAEQASHIFNSSLVALDWHPGGRLLCTRDSAGTVGVIDSQTGESRALGHHKGQVATTVFSPDGRYVFTGGWERELICWDLRTMERAFSIGLNSFVMQIRSDGGECAVITHSGVQLHAFELPAYRELTEDLGPFLQHVSFSPDGRWIAASAEKRLGVWDLFCGGPGALVEEGFEALTFFSPDGRELFGSRSQETRYGCFRWQITPATDRVSPPGLRSLPVRKPVGFKSLCVSSNSVVLTSSQGSQVLPLQDIEAIKDRCVPTTPGISGSSADGRWLAIYRPYGATLHVYHLPGLEETAKLTHTTSIHDFQFSPLSDEVAICSVHGGVEFWSTKNWERTRVMSNFTGIIFSPDGRGWWLTKDSRTAGFYDSHTLEPLLPLPTSMLPLAVSPDARHLAVSVDARQLLVWDLPEVRKKLQELGVDWSD